MKTVPCTERATEKAKRKRARYVAGTIRLVLRQYTTANDDCPVAFMSTVGQMKFISTMLDRVGRGSR